MLWNTALDFSSHQRAIQGQVQFYLGFSHRESLSVLGKKIILPFPYRGVLILNRLPTLQFPDCTVQSREGDYFSKIKEHRFGWLWKCLILSWVETCFLIQELNSSQERLYGELFFSLGMGCGILNFLTRDRTCTPCLELQSLNHWTTREVPQWQDH